MKKFEFFVYVLQTRKNEVEELTSKTPDYQLGWAVWAASRLLDTLKRNFVLCSEKSPHPTLLHNIKGTYH